jgi:hypothetical protein
MATGEGKSSNNKNSNNQDQESKECLVYFRPKEGWKGEFGFDWIRMGESFEKEYVNDEGTESGTSPSNIGKYVGPTKSSTVVYERDTNSFTIESEPFDPSNYTKDIELSKFATSFIIDHGWKFPVLEENGTLYFFDYGLCEEYHKTVKFDYIYTEIIKPKKDEKKKGKKKKDKKKDEKKDEKKKPGLELLDVDEVGQSQSETTSKERPKFELLDVDEPNNKQPKQTVYHYRIEYEKGDVEEVEISDEKGESITFKKSERKKAVSKNVMETWHTSQDFVKRIWNNYNMDAESLPKDERHIRNVNVDCGSYKRLEIEREEGPIHCTDIFEYECCKLIKLTHIKQEWNSKTEKLEPKKYSFHGAYNIVQGINKKNIKLDSNCLNNPYLTVRTLSKNSQNVRISATFAPAIPQRFKLVKGQGVNNNGETCVTISQAEGNVITMKSTSRGFVQSKEPVILRPFTDDGFLHTYWDDLYVDGRKFVAKNYLNDDPPTLDWYYYPTLGLTGFGKQNKNWKKDVKDQAELKLSIQGTFDEIDLISSNEKNLQLSRKKIKSTSDDDLTVTLKGLCKPKETIIAKSKGVEVGHLDVNIIAPWYINICFITVNCLKKKSDLTIDAADSILPGNRRWSLDSDSHYMDILAQGGCILTKTAEDLSVNVLEVDQSRGPLEDTSDDPSNCSRYLVWDEECGENVFLFEGATVGGKSIAEYLDSRFLDAYPDYAGQVRVYILDKYMESIKNYEKESYADKSFYNGLVMPNLRNVILLFKKSIEANGGFDSETLAHELGHLFGLNHSFDNREPFTFKASTTTNVMDYSNKSHSLVPYQWKKINTHLIKVYDDLNNEAKTMKEKGSVR